MTEVADASREQTDGISQITVAVGQMDKVTQSNAATAEESAAAAEELNAQAEVMEQSVTELLQLVGSKSESEPRKPVVPVGHTRHTRLSRPAAKNMAPVTSNNGNGLAGAAPELITSAKRRGDITQEGDFKEF